MPQREASIKIDTETAEARASLEGVEEGLQDVNIAARQADQGVSGVADAGDIAKIEALKGRIDELEDELDSTSRSASRTRVQLGLVTTSTGAFDTALIGTIGTLGVATAALGTFTAALGAAEAGGIALSAKFGPEEIQDRFRSVQAEARGAAQVLGQEFAPAARFAANAASGLIDLVAANADDIENFADDLGRLARAGAFGTPGQLIMGGITALSQRGQSADAEQRGLDAQQERIRREVESQQDRADLLEAAGVPRAEVVETRISALQKLREEFSTFAETLSGPQLKEAEATLREIQKRISRLQEEAELFEDPLAGALEGIGTVGAAQEAGVVEQDVPRAPVGVGDPTPGRAPGGSGLNRLIERGSRRAARRLPSQSTLRDRTIRAQMQASSQEAGQAIDDTVNRQLEQGIQLASQLGSTLVRSARQGGLEFNQVFGQILSTVGAVIGVANPAAGAAISGAGQLVGSFQHGGRVDTPLQIVGEQGPELVAMPQGSQVSSTDDTMAMMSQMVQAVQGDTEVKVDSFAVNRELEEVATEQIATGSRVNEPV